MSIVLNENEWAREMIEAGSLGKQPFETLCRVAGYYVSSGYGKKEARKMLDTFLLRCDRTVSLQKWSYTIDRALERALKYNPICIEHICITKPEMDKINALDGKQIRRLAFTLLCLSKYHDIVNPNCDHWVSDKDNEIMKLANINTSILRQAQMYHTLIELGYIHPSKRVDNTNVRVCFSEDGDTAMNVSDFRNLGYQYMRYCGEPYFECANCGITTKYSDPEKGRKQKYCKTCAAEVAMRQKVNYVMRRRDGERNGINTNNAV